MTTIKNSYLMWIGKEHYSTIGDWNNEAITQGISKRVPNANVGQALLNEGTVIFVAHDEGEYTECGDCVGTIQNPERRKLITEMDRLDDENSKLAQEMADADTQYADGIVTVEQRDATKTRCVRLQLNRDKKANELHAQHDALPETIEAGTGGTVIIEGGEAVDYRTYNYQLHHKGLTPADSANKTMCEPCGGTGRLPEGKVFGVFLPSAVEYILKAEDGEDIKKQMETERGFRTVEQTVLITEAKRLCGKRKAGGVYVVTDVQGKPSKRAKDLVKALVEAGKITPEAVEINGDFVKFLAPIDIDAKRFRGLKKWNLDPRAEAEAEMIMEAVAS